MRVRSEIHGMNETFRVSPDGAVVDFNDFIICNSGGIDCVVAYSNFANNLTGEVPTD